jgi:hypothetical protein
VFGRVLSLASPAAARQRLTSYLLIHTLHHVVTMIAPLTLSAVLGVEHSCFGFCSLLRQ